MGVVVTYFLSEIQCLQLVNAETREARWPISSLLLWLLIEAFVTQRNVGFIDRGKKQSVAIMGTILFSVRGYFEGT